MKCQRCGARPAVRVLLRHNVGMLFMRRTESTSGRVCRGCLGSAFLHHQLRNLVLGWWGMLSAIMTAYYLVDNVINYVAARGDLWNAARATRAHAKVNGPSAERLLLAFDATVVRRKGEGDTASDIIDDLVDATGVPRQRAEAFVSQVIENSDTASV